MMTLKLGVVVLSAMTSSMVNAGESLSIGAKPAMSFAPATVNVHVMIEPDARNRSVEVIVDSPDFYRSSEIPLDGDRAPRTTLMEFRNLPAGDYELRATLLGSGGSVRASAHQEVRVVGGGPEPDRH
jgi:hypothetical protein